MQMLRHTKLKTDIVNGKWAVSVYSAYLSNEDTQSSLHHNLCPDLLIHSALY